MTEALIVLGRARCSAASGSGLTYTEFFDHYKFYPLCTKEQWEGMSALEQFDWLAEQHERELLGAILARPFDTTGETVTASYEFDEWNLAAASKFFYSKLKMFKEHTKRLSVENQTLKLRILALET